MPHSTLILIQRKRLAHFGPYTFKNYKCLRLRSCGYSGALKCSLTFNRCVELLYFWPRFTSSVIRHLPQQTQPQQPWTSQGRGDLTSSGRPSVRPTSSGFNETESQEFAERNGCYELARGWRTTLSRDVRFFNRGVSWNAGYWQWREGGMSL